MPTTTAHSLVGVLADLARCALAAGLDAAAIRADRTAGTITVAAANTPDVHRWAAEVLFTDPPTAAPAEPGMTLTAATGTVGGHLITVHHVARTPNGVHP